jgi:hypothetical protein
VSYASGVVTLTLAAPLDYGTTYKVIVSGSVADRAGNPLGADDTCSFNTPYQTFIDTSVADFMAGSGTCTIDLHIGDVADRQHLPTFAVIR